MKLGTKTFIGLAAAACLQVASYADTVLYQTGFEAPSFSTGSLAGQANWGGATAPQYGVVQSAFARTGSQALRIDAIAGSGQFLNGLNLNYDATGNPDKVVRFSVDAYITSGALAYFDIFAIVGNAGFLGQLLTIPTNTVTLSGSPAQPFTLNQWHNFVLEMDFETRIQTAWLDGAQLATHAFESDASTGIGQLLIGRQSGNGTGSMYLDNLSVTARAATPDVSDVPEPGALALVALGLGLIGISGRRRRPQTGS